MKVRISLTVDIDRDAWVLNYGTPREDVREDVRAYVEQSIREILGTVGVLR